MNKAVILPVVLFLTTFIATPSFGYPVERNISNEWTWFEDYLFVYTQYTLACEPGCVCKVGMGVKAFGKPRGERKQFTDTIDITVVGMGAIHIKRVGGKASCKARIAAGGDPELIPIIKRQPWNP